MRQISRRNLKHKKVDRKVQRDGDGYGYYATKGGTDVGIYGEASTKTEAARKSKKAKAKLLRGWLSGEW